MKKIVTSITPSLKLSKAILLITIAFYSIQANAQSGNKIYLNVGRNVSAPSPWNNTLSDPGANSSFTDLKDSNGNHTGINFELTTPWGGWYNAGATTGNNSGIVPDEVLAEYYWFGVFGAPEEVQFKITGLIPGASYNVHLLSSSVFRLSGVTDNGSTVFTLNGVSHSVTAEGNTTSTADFAAVTVPSSGELEFTASKGPSTPAGYLNAIIIDLPSGMMYSPSNVTLTPSGSTVSIGWKDNNSDETGYEIYRADLTSPGSYQLLETTSANDTTFIDSTVVEGYTYGYKLRAISAALPSGFSSIHETTIGVSTGSSITVADSVLINFSQSYSASGWFNTGRAPNVGSTFGDLPDENGKDTGMSIHFLSAWGGVNDSGPTTGSNSGVVPDNVLKEYYWFGVLGAPQDVKFKIAGLVPGIPYNLKLVGASVFRGIGVTDNGSTIYSIGQLSDTLDVEGNVSHLAIFNSVKANALGEIVIAASKAPDATAGFINGIIIQIPAGILYAPGGFTATYISGTGASLTWLDPNSAETGYQIWRRNVTTNSAWSLVTTTAANVTSYIDTGVTTDQQYEYKLRGTNAFGNSAFGAVHNVRTFPVKTIKINFSQYDNAGFPWNSTGQVPTNGLKLSTIYDQNHINTGVTMELLGTWGGVNAIGQTTGNNSGIVPDSVLQEFYYFGFNGGADTVKLKFSGFAPHNSINFKFVASSVFHGAGITDNGTTFYQIGDKSASLNVEANTDNGADIFDIVTDSTGVITVTLLKGATTTVGYINGLVMEVPESMLYAPANFGASFVEGSGNSLSWTDTNDQETGYEIYRYDFLVPGTVSLVTTTSSNASSYLDTSITEGHRYGYYLKAVNSASGSLPSVTVNVRSVPVKKVYVNFDQSSPASAPWNNTNAVPAAGLLIPNLKDEFGYNTNISLSFLSEWGGVNAPGGSTGNDSGIVPDDVLHEYYWFGFAGAPNEVQMKLSNLDTAHNVNIGFIASSSFRGGGITNNGTTVYTVGSQTASLDVDGNTSHAATIFDNSPDDGGEIQILAAKAPGTPVGYLNAIIIELPKYMLYSSADFFAEYITGTGVSLAWSDNNRGETGYKLYRKDPAIGPQFVLLDSLDSTHVSYVDTTAVVGRQYSYRLRAFSATELSGWSSTQTVDCIQRKKVYISFGKDLISPAPWNNTSKDPVAGGMVFDRLKDENGDDSGITVSLDNPWGGYFAGGSSTGSNSGVVPDTVLLQYYYFGIFGGGNTENLTISRLTPGMSYNFKFMASSVFHSFGITDNGHTIFSSQGQSQSVHVEGNTTALATLRSLIADENGKIVIQAIKGGDAVIGYLNAMIVEMPDQSANFYAVSDGAWTDAIWSHDSTATVATLNIPSSAVARIDGHHVTLDQMAAVSDLKIGASGGNAGTLTVQGSLLQNFGSLKVDNGNSSNTLALNTNATLQIRPKQIRILPLGNSITQGTNINQSYRYRLWKKLLDSGISFDMIGSQSTNSSGNPTFADYNGLTFDEDNEGHYGYRADQIRDGLPAWIAGNTPDIVLMEVGTNDMMQGETTSSTGDEIEEIIAILRDANPKVRIFLGKLLPNVNADVTSMNSVISTISSSSTTTDSPITLVDHYTGMSLGSDFVDGIHPNSGGEEKMAQKWFDAISANLYTSVTGSGTALCDVTDTLTTAHTYSSSYVSPGCVNKVKSSRVVSLGHGFESFDGANATFETSTASFIDQWAFQYKYDGKRRQIAKKVPGADWVYTVYDERDRVVLTQDGNQRIKKQWMFHKYDELNRPVLTGVRDTTEVLTQPQMQAVVDAHFAKNSARWGESYLGSGSGHVHGYSNKAYPVCTNASGTSVDVHKFLTVTYYDNYAFKALLADTAFDYHGSTLDTAMIGGRVYQQTDSAEAIMDRTGMVTGGKTRLLNDTTFLWGVMYYDNKHRTIQSVAHNMRGGIDRHSMLLDFTGKVLRSVIRQTLPSLDTLPALATQTTARKFEYDHVNRMLRTWHSVNGLTPVLLSKNEYNEIGQLVDKKLHSTNGTSFKQSLDFRYGIRGWLNSINNATLVTDYSNDDANDLFGMDLLYEAHDTGLSNSPQFNGNISAIKWSRNLALGAVKDQAYIYAYDTLDRIQSATYKLDSVTWSNSKGKFNESGFRYDLNGNILALLRKASNGGTMDNLTYGYGTGDLRSNRLLSVSDAGNSAEGFKDGNVTGSDYLYDANGNMVADKNKSITKIVYNLMNLPDTVVKSNGQYLRYTYDASGRKLAQQVFSSGNAVAKTAEYQGELYLENDTLKFINHEEGRIVMTGAAPEYQYHLKDHLGNVRLTFTSKKDSITEKATLEDSNLTAEEGQFLNLTDIRRVNSRVFDHTYNGTSPSSAYSNRLSGITSGGSTKEVIGMAKSISVMPGDRVDMSVFVKYVDTSNPGTTMALANLVNAIAAGTAPAGTVVDGSGYPTFSESNFPLAGLLDKSGDESSLPKAYLNWLVVDRNFNPLFDQSGFQPLSSAAEEDGTTISGGNPEGRAHEELTGTINVKEPGYVYVWVSNDNETPVEVYFDDLTVLHVKSSVVQMDDYYPFGATFNSYAREDNLSNRYKYQHKEYQDELGLNLYDFRARYYDPWLTRTITIDPLSYKFVSISPYSWGMENPVKYIDPTGKAAYIVYYSKKDKGHDNPLFHRYVEGKAYKGDNQFVKSVYAAVQHLNDHGAGDNFSKLAKRDERVEINQAFNHIDKSPDCYACSQHSILWDPTGGVKTTNEKLLSPATLLDHEIDHKLDDILMAAKGDLTHMRNAIKNDDQYDTPEERRVITGREQRTALKLGEIRSGEKTRENHNGHWYRTISPTSTIASPNQDPKSEDQ